MRSSWSLKSSIATVRSLAVLFSVIVLDIGTVIVVYLIVFVIVVKVILKIQLSGTGAGVAGFVV